MWNTPASRAATTVSSGSGGSRPGPNDLRRANLWLRLTSSGWDQPAITVEQRELARRSRLASWIILGLLAFDIVLIPLGQGDISTLTAIAIFGLGLMVAAVLNRAGKVGVAGGLLVLLLAGGVMGSLTSQPTGLTLDALPAFDLLTIGVVVAATILPRSSAFVVAIFNSVIICLDFFLEPHYYDLQLDIQSYGSTLSGSLALLARPLALQLIIAVVAYLWVRGTDEAIRRADRAEEIAQLEHSIAEQKRQLDIGVQQILQTHIRAANGDFNARAPLGQENVLWQIAASLNNLLSRLQRAGYAEHQLRRTEEELHRLAGAIDDAQAGRRPIWPAPSGTAADLIIERISRGARPNAPLSGAQERSAYPEPFPPMAPMPPLAAPASQPWDPGMPPASQMPPFSGPSQPLPDQWGQQPDQWGQQPDQWGQQPDQWGQQPDQWGQQDQGRMPSNPWVFPPEADERS